MQRFAFAASFTTLLAATAGAQTYLHLPASFVPDAVELADYEIRPLMQTNCRLQMFFDAAETGSSAFTALELALRYDGPIPQVGAPGPFQIQRLQVLIGSSAAGIPGADFAQNLTQPLQTVFDGPWTYLPDPGSGFPQPWGGPGNSLRFPFTTPAAVTIPTGGWFVVELRMQGNNIAGFGFSHAILDGVETFGGVTDGTRTSYGTGCSAATGAPAATISATGNFAPGTAHFVAGQNLGANTLAIGVLGGSNAMSTFGPLPVTLPGTTCSLLASTDITWLAFTNAAGAVAPDLQSSAIVVPPVPAFAGARLYEQWISLVPAANPFGLIVSDALDVQLGSIQPPTTGIYLVSHGTQSDAAIADEVRPFGYAVELQVQ
ncbi:MAG: hypothetical protein AB7O97_08325 [Planctomycetota bacterium]